MIVTQNQELILGGAIANGTTANSLAIGGSNGWTSNVYLGGNNTYTGATTVNQGKLLLAGSNAYAGGPRWGRTTTPPRSWPRTPGPWAAAAVTVDNNGTLAYAAEANAALAIGGNLTIAGTSNVTIGGSIGSTPTSAAINVAGAATVAGGGVKVNVYGITGVAPSTSGAYTLLSGGPGSALGSGATYTLGTVYNNTNFTVGEPSVTSTALTVPVSPASPLATAYWTGGYSPANNTGGPPTAAA